MPSPVAPALDVSNLPQDKLAEHLHATRSWDLNNILKMGFQGLAPITGTKNIYPGWAIFDVSHIIDRHLVQQTYDALPNITETESSQLVQNLISGTITDKAGSLVKHPQAVVNTPLPLGLLSVIHFVMGFLNAGIPNINAYYTTDRIFTARDIFLRRSNGEQDIQPTAIHQDRMSRFTINVNLLGDGTILYPALEDDKADLSHPIQTSEGQFAILSGGQRGKECRRGINFPGWHAAPRVTRPRLTLSWTVAHVPIHQQA